MSPNNRANLIALGDLNTMGKGRSIPAGREIHKLAQDAEKHHMQLLKKNEKFTWHKGSKYPRRKKERKLLVSELAHVDKSDLDHVIASKNLNFQAFELDGSEVIVKGWNQLSGGKRAIFLYHVSDHSALYAEVI